MAKARVRIGSQIRPAASNPGRLVVVADAGHARLLRVNGRRGSESLVEVASMELPVARMHPREVVSDKTGRVFERAARGHGPRTAARHGAASDHDPRAADVARFARRIARRLDVERRKGTFGELSVIAAPHFLGVLRPELSGPTKQSVAREVPRDLVHSEDKLILRHVLK